MLEMMGSLEKLQEMQTARSAETSHVSELTLRPMSTANKGHVLLCKTEHSEAALRDEKTGDLTDYGVNCEDYYHANDGWSLLRYADIAAADTYPPCWCVADVDYFCPANPVGWVLDLGLPEGTQNELREKD